MGSHLARALGLSGRARAVANSPPNNRAGKKYGFVAARLFNEQIIDQLLGRDQGVRWQLHETRFWRRPSEMSIASMYGRSYLLDA